jgi:menaquinone-9 beta-reductase
MKKSVSSDVIVIGAGPGGSASAKRCSDAGLKTIMIEKRKLPRDKVCTGMIMGNWAFNHIQEEFGNIPDSILASPSTLRGHRFYVDGADVHTLETHTLLSWRKDLDYWFAKRAGDSGVSIEENTRAFRIIPQKNRIRVDIIKDGLFKTLYSRYVIGADGATSFVRRSIYPDLEVPYSGPIRVWYQGALHLDESYIHWFFPKRRPRPRFNVNQKNGMLLLEGAGIIELKDEIERTLIPYGLDPNWKPIKKDGCAIALLHQQLLNGQFIPAKGNVLLVGDAAGLILPITFEGIGSAIKSGIAAACSIIESAEKNCDTAPKYLSDIQGIIETIRHLYKDQFQLKDNIDLNDPNEIATGLISAYNETLTQQE